MRELKLMVPAEFDGAEAQTFLKSRGFSRRALIRLKQTGGLTRGGALLRTAARSCACGSPTTPKAPSRIRS